MEEFRWCYDVMSCGIARHTEFVPALPGKSAFDYGLDTLVMLVGEGD